MNETAMQDISTLFKTHGIRGLDKLRLYIHAVIILHTIEQHSITPCEAWEHPDAAALREYLPTHEAIDKERAILLAELIREIEAADYFRIFLPELCLGNSALLFGSLMDVPEELSHSRLIHSLLRIWAVMMVRRHMNRQPYPDGHQSMDLCSLSTLVFAAYEDWMNDHPKFGELQLTQKDIFEVWQLMNRVPYYRKPISTKGKLVKTLTALRKEGCPDEVILQCYFIAKTAGRLKAKSGETASPVNYFRKVFLKGRQGADSPADESGSPMIDYFSITEELERCMEDWKKTPPLDFSARCTISAS